MGRNLACESVHLTGFGVHVPACMQLTSFHYVMHVHARIHHSCASHREGRTVLVFHRSRATLSWTAFNPQIPIQKHKVQIPGEAMARLRKCLIQSLGEVMAHVVNWSQAPLKHARATQSW